jgi:hypothetical protein
MSHPYPHRIVLVGLLGLLLATAMGEEEGATRPFTTPLPVPEGYLCPFEDPAVAWAWIDYRTRSILTFGRICEPVQALELAICQVGGKSHEAIIMTFGRAEHIHACALLLGADLPRLPPPPDGGPPVEAIYDTVTCTVEWMEPPAEDAAPGTPGELVSHRVEKLILLATTGEPLPEVSWLFRGSRFVSIPKDWRNKDDTMEVYAADYFDGGLLTTYNDPYAVFDNPLPEGVNDEVFFPNAEALPPRGTPLRIRFTFGEPIRRSILASPQDGRMPRGGEAPTGGDSGEEEPPPPEEAPPGEE